MHSLFAALRAVVGDDGLLTEPADCWPYGYDNSRRHLPPLAVAFPANHGHVAQLVKICNDYRIAVIPRGRGTGTAGASVPEGSALVLSTERMSRIARIDPDNRLMIVEPGVTNQEVQRAAASHGFFWAPDPTSAAVCTVGGNLACNAAGPRAVKYGTTRDNVLALRAVAGDGREFRTGSATTKGVVGYDLTRLLIGSEGTLAIITEATLRLTPLPEQRRTLRAFYSSMEGAAQAVARIMAQPITPCALEFMDQGALAMIRPRADLQIPERAASLLMIEVDGSPQGIDAAAAAVGASAASGRDVISVEIAATEEEVDRLWETRKALSPVLRTVAPKKINEDVVVPVSRIPELISGLEGLALRYQIAIVSFGHAGNGNIHVNLLVDPADEGQMARALPCLSDVFDLVLQLGGTLSGEHGIGSEKRDYVARELDEVALGVMRSIKSLFDPEGILNPGKKIPPARTSAAT